MTRDQSQETDEEAGAPTTPPPRSCFVTTRWTVVVKAGQSDTTHAREALAQLCRMYWYPLYAYVRRKGYAPADAEDLTQAFFARVLEEGFIATADQEKGRFRSYLLTHLNHFLADEWDRLKAQKRGGGQRLIPLEGGTAETRYQLEPADNRSPDRLFEYRWAVTLLQQVVERLQREYEVDGKGALFQELKGCLAQARAAVAYEEATRRLGMSEGALRVAAHRLRQRYRDLLRAEIAETVSGPAEVEEELRYLFRVLYTCA
ncbi:MAG: sigma-70 family RNA polymerase sigma factor [Verrucomicrobia bacterium]|nr:sigma-70 family RNA polymerase sigma factor [Verrucomicrobiota bacterium]